MPTNRRPNKQPTRRPKVAGLRKRQTRNEELLTEARSADPADAAERPEVGRAAAEQPEAAESGRSEAADRTGGVVAEPEVGRAEEAEPELGGEAVAEREGGAAAENPGTAEAKPERASKAAEPEQGGEASAERTEEAAEPERAGLTGGAREDAGGAGGAADGGTSERSGAAKSAERSEADGLPERGEAAVTEPESAERSGAAGEAEADTGKRGPAWTLWAATVVLAALAVWFGFEAYAARYTGPAANEALVSAGETSEVSGQVSDAVEKLFSYDFNDTAKTEEAARNLLTGDAVQRYEELFAVVKDQAPQQQLIVTTTVKERSVTRLQGNRAELLLFVDQHARRANAPGENAGPAQISVSAEKQGETWKITQITLR
ncbi:hypothetical protein ABT337_19510 [Saccharopolyspora hirsuta]|uniref:Mce-associated membrane protein n=1 Tax=Saccharopolyspora hirsuta TaxID=1837 RepID=A0A5M7C4X2_SACHI|nr:hypothetical protein [Saccharopolyspora hirsuta]KAA5833395.1 hypothetical protein F1721_13960 [Saccharopolyspora hirsuta]